MVKNLKAVITDLDGVIRHFPSERDQEIESRFGLPAGSFSETAFSFDLLLPTILGKQPDSQWRAQILGRLQDRFPDQDLKAAFDEWSVFPGEPDLRVIKFLRSICGGAPLVLLTNATDRLLADLEAIGLSHAFDRIFNSSELGMIKPDERVFQHVLTELGISSGNALFIDDSPNNVTAAKKLGIQSYLFKNYEEMCKELYPRGRV